MLFTLYCSAVHLLLFFFYLYGDHRDLHVLTHSFPTRLSSDLPAFDDANCERDTLVRPIHPNTTRSSAWRSAGVQQVEAVVNQVLHAKYRLGIEGGRYLFGAENERAVRQAIAERSEEHTSELQSLMRISYAVFCLKKKKHKITKNNTRITYHNMND